jgi:hypothetical protein
MGELQEGLMSHWQRLTVPRVMYSDAAILALLNGVLCDLEAGRRRLTRVSPGYYVEGEDTSRRVLVATGNNLLALT